MGGALRILQAGELCLDEPLRGFSSELPHIFQFNGLQCSLIDARYQAARNLFEAAISERVDLVLLAGKLCTHENDPRSYWFLQEQFAQLLKHRIVVVCVETTNSFRWPSTIPLPENVRVINRDQSKEIDVDRMSRPLSFDWHKEEQSSESKNAGRQQSLGFSVQLHERGGCITNVSYGSPPNNELDRVPIHALQASSLSQSGPFQATLVEFDGVTGYSSTPVRTEAVACETWHFDVQQNETISHLRDRLIEELCDSECRRGLTSVPTLLGISLSVSSLSESTSLTFDPSSQRELLSAIQNGVREKQLKIWPCRVEIEASTLKQQLLNESLPIQIAFHELAELNMSEATDDLDRQALNINQQSFQRLKSRAALRIPNLLAE